MSDNPWRHPEPPLRIPADRIGSVPPHQPTVYEELSEEELEAELAKTGKSAGRNSKDNTGMKPQHIHREE